MHAKGDKLDHFTIVGEIGRGGMGTIYKALDETLNRYVALKIIHPQLAVDDQLMERFKAEAMTQAQLSHSNIATVYSFSRIGNEFVMVMEYVEGKSLKELIQKEGILPIGYAVTIINSVLAGLAYAHEKQVIHRDVKPANILVGEKGIVKLLDFGIAKIFGSEGLTKTGALIGTPWYCSPEQILGSDMDFSTDIYSTSVTFYQMITGRVPFDSETKSEYQIQKAHLETPPPRPSLFNNQINRQLERILLKGLAKKREKRYASAQEMIQDLKAVEPYYTQSSSAPNQKRKKVRHRLYALLWVLIPLAALLLVLVLRKGGVTWQEEARQTEETSGKPEAEKPSVDAFATSVTREDPVRTVGDVPIVEKKNAVKQQKTQEKKIPLDHAETGPESEAASKNGKEADEGREQDPQQRFRFEENLRRVQKLMSDNRPAMAERMADNLVKRNSSPRALSLAGSVKFFSGKYKQGEALWLRALDGGGEIRIKAAHAHGFVTRGCVGVLVIRKKLIQYDSISKSQHNFVIITGELVAASARGKQLLLSRRDKKGKIQRDLFLLDWSRDDHDVKRFSDFLGELFEEE